MTLKELLAPPTRSTVERSPSEQLPSAAGMNGGEFGGATCASALEQQSCNAASCPVDCIMGDWSSWSACSQTCGEATRTRTRVIQRDAAYGGVACETNLSASQRCFTPCPVDCAVSEWVATPCSKTCGVGEIVESRLVLVRPVHGGVACPALRRSHACALGPCPVHCEVHKWSSWGECSKTFGDGRKERNGIRIHSQ